MEQLNRAVYSGSCRYRTGVACGRDTNLMCVAILVVCGAFFVLRSSEI